ncbi:MAG: DNA mismatch repair endonuclease MutL [Fibrobacterota bacterium]|nr:DNA mismatch repair endonuclease MutL [Chitinispirillaceae bacterium]
METKKQSVIQVLPQSVIEKIAAGEVIERPASVLKEIVENAIDAGATRIDITIEDAGFSLIKVSDNGYGMSQEDIIKCFLPHATSKITSADDLFSIATMGFRGEALASIAAVSRTTVISSNDTSGLGYELSYTGGEAGQVKPQQHLQGTTVTVRDLFFNVPARKKFMKTRKGEQLAITRLVEQLVIPFPSIHFTLTVESRRVMDVLVADSPLARIADIAGHEFAKGLIECKGMRDGMEILAFVSTPEQLKERPRFQSLYVNLRRIDNDSVTFSIREAFAQYLGATYKPAFFAFLDIDPSRIDVNVHPTKQQVKFDDERELFGFVYGVVKQGIGAVVMKPDQFQTEQDSLNSSFQSLFTSQVPEPQTDAIPLNLPLQFTTRLSPVQHLAASPQNDQSAPSASSQSLLSFPQYHQDEQKEVDQTVEKTVELSDVESGNSWELIPCYQIHGMFILAPIKNGILLIDQHAAEERVLYEQALEDIKRGRSASQQLLFPIILELSPTEKSVVDSGIAFFNAFGFEVSDFGGRSLSISAIPAFLRDGAVEDTIRGMIKYLLDGKAPEFFLEPEKRFAAAFACGAAIKAGQKLSQEEMNALMNRLFSAKNPYTCPHGRPTLVRMSIDELSRRFLR